MSKVEDLTTQQIAEQASAHRAALAKIRKESAAAVETKNVDNKAAVAADLAAARAHAESLRMELVAAVAAAKSGPPPQS